MENASKALILAGEILIAVLVVTLISTIILLFGKFSANMNDRMSEKQIAMFNNNFVNYSGRIDITAGEIATAINFAKQNNDNYELSRNDNSIHYIKVYINEKDFFNSNNFINSSDKYVDPSKFKIILNEFIKNNNTNLFSCNIKIENCKVTTNNTTKITNINTENAAIEEIKTDDTTGLVTQIKFITVTGKEKFENYNVKNKSSFTIDGKNI